MAGGPKTFKSISSWENWPSKTGYAPSLDVLARLAELYECTVADLLADYADFRHRDKAHRTRQHLTDVHTLANGVASVAPAPADLTALADRLEDMDVHEVAQVGAAWAQQLNGHIDRRALLLKLSASLALSSRPRHLRWPRESHRHHADPPCPRVASRSPVSGTVDMSTTARAAARSSVASTTLVLRHEGGRIVGQSLPHSLDSRLRPELSVAGSIATGTWSERTDSIRHRRDRRHHR